MRKWNILYIYDMDLINIEIMAEYVDKVKDNIISADGVLINLGGYDNDVSISEITIFEAPYMDKAYEDAVIREIQEGQ